ncbi:hypothetical protein ANCCAN_12711 [Ancylostoma caninum]|uniref:Uncharacterized protein n=1 Tax=Ancylostoma caninum TaxID=29170 RepID=A0A368GC96_ANCCA|nr:hypothetical protein ANCCAN_12711 [Ancylostoma caninum]
MARMDMSTSVTKVRRSIPRILSSSKKNSQLSPVHTNHIIKEDVDTEWHVSQNCSPTKDSCSPEQHKEEVDNAHDQLFALSECKEGTNKELDAESKDSLEIHVSKMVTVRQGPQIYVAPRTLRCALATNTISEDTDVTKTLTPNELLLALVNYFAPPMEVEETPPLLERELTPLDSNYAIPTDDMALENGVGYSSDLSSETVQPIALSSSSSTHISSSPEEISPRSNARLGQLGSIVSDGVSTSSTRYPPLTLGGAIGIRRPRSSSSQLMNNNLTLDQLNPTLAEALAAMKAKSGVVSKPSGNTTFTNGSDSFSNRRESLPTRMSGPVTLESLAPTSSTSPDGVLNCFPKSSLLSGDS